LFLSWPSPARRDYITQSLSKRISAIFCEITLIGTSRTLLRVWVEIDMPFARNNPP